MIDWKEAARHYRFHLGLSRRLEIDLKRQLYDREAENAWLREEVHMLRERVSALEDKISHIKVGAGGALSIG
jgi:hypothetical protein